MEANSEMMKELAEKFKNSETVKALDRYFSEKSMMEVLGVARREAAHTSFLMWLLDSNESHGLGLFPFTQLLKILVRRDKKQGRDRHNKVETINTGTCIKDLDKAINNNSIKIENLNVTKENVIDSGREDIHLSCSAHFNSFVCNLHAIIENKVLSDETNQQTEKYFKYYCEQNASSGNNDIFLFVYLTPLTNPELDKISEPQCTCKQFIQINYQDILCDIVEQCLSLDIKPRVKTILKEYIHGLELNTENCIMAISKHTSTMLQSALTDFEPLISTFFNYIISDPNTNEDIREAAELYLRRSKIKFKFNGITINSKVGLVCEVLKTLIPQKVSPEDFNKEFRISRRQDYKSVKEVLKQNMLTKTNEELSQPSIAQNDPLRMETNQCPKKYKSLPSSTNIYYYNDWNAASIDFFLYTYFRNRAKWGLNEEKYCIYVVK